jgi:tetratricopeptide (TPR) repeat protein
MRTKAAGAAIASLLLALGCTKVQTKQALKDAHKQYRDENYKKAIEYYEKALAMDPNLAEAHFYLGSSHQALFRPGKDTPDNKMHLDKAVEEYKKSLELNDGHNANLKTVKRNTLAALTSIYAEEPYRNFEEAKKYANLLVADNPNDPRNLYAMANLFEKFGKVTEAEETYKKIAEMNPTDAKACGALAAFYNKPLWEGRAKFDQAIATLERCANLDPSDPGGYQKLAVFYWDKAYRDPLLSDQQKNAYADKGLEAVDKALKIKPDYFDAIIFKGLLYRVKASVASNPREKMDFLEQAQNLQKQGLELKKEAAAAAAAASPGPGAGK